MRISPISTVYGRNLSTKNNVSFKKIEEKNRDKIIANMPDITDVPEALVRQREANIKISDRIVGATLKWGGPGCERGLIYADLDKEHVNKSCMKEWYEEELETEHLEDEENFRWFIHDASHISSEENPDGTRVVRPPSPPSSSSSDDRPRELTGMEYFFEIGWF